MVRTCQMGYRLSGLGQVADTPMSQDQSPRRSKRKRPEVNYHIEGSGDENDSDDENLKSVKNKRARTTRKFKPLPKNKIFPFMELPAELRNRIYEECLLGLPSCEEDPAKEYVSPAYCDDSDLPRKRTDKPGMTVYLRSKQKSYRKTVELCSEDHAMLDCFDRRTRTCCKHHASLTQVLHGQIPDEQPLQESPRPVLIPALLRVSKQIHKEAMPILYGQRFVFLDVVALIPFLNMIGPSAAQMVRHVQVNSWMQGRSRKNVAYYAASLMSAKKLTNLESFRIDCRIGHFYSWSGKQSALHGKRVARKLFRELYPWFYEVGHESKDPVAALQIVNISAANFEQRWESWPQPVLQLSINSFKVEMKRLLSLPRAY